MHLSRHRRANICFQPWLMHMYLSMKYIYQTICPLDWYTRCHPLELLCLTFRWVALVRMNVKEKKNPSASILHAQEGMINVLLGHDHSVRNIASTIVIHRYQNNDKDAFYLFFDPLTASVIEPFINLTRHSLRAARTIEKTKTKKCAVPPTHPTSHL